MRKNITVKSLTSVSVVLLILHIFCPAGRAVLKGGCAKVNITPPLGIPLIGSYGKPSDDILDDLYAKTLVLDDGTNTVAIVSADLLYTPLEEITDPVRRIIAEKIGIGARNILVCATHTHSGPEVFSKSKLRSDKRIDVSTVDRFYLETLIKKLAGSVLLAHKNMQPVKIGAAKGELPEIVFNRRPLQSKADGRQRPCENDIYTAARGRGNEGNRNRQQRINASDIRHSRRSGQTAFRPRRSGGLRAPRGRR